MAKIVTMLCDGATGILLAVILALTGVMGVPKLLGYDVVAVLSGSMEPTYHVNSVIYVNKKIPPEEIREGDPITFYSGETLVTHRVTKIDRVNECFTTQGDANDVEDLQPVHYSSYVGRAGLSIPALGLLAIYIKTKTGLMLLAGIFIIFILLQLIPEILKPEDGKEDNSGNM